MKGARRTRDSCARLRIYGSLSKRSQKAIAVTSDRCFESLSIQVDFLRKRTIELPRDGLLVGPR